MSAVQIVKTFITALQSRDLELADQLMTDDFVLNGWTEQPLDKSVFLAMQGELDDAMPDFSYNLNDVHKQGDKVVGLIQVTGTNTNNLSLPMFGIPFVQYTSNAIGLPQVSVKFLFDGDKIKAMRVESVPGGGLSGLLQQLDTELPILPSLKELNQLGQTPYIQEVEIRGNAPPWPPETTIMDENAGEK